MAKVPYSAAPQVDPTSRGTEDLGYQRIGGVSGAAFGGGTDGGVGKALAGLGQTIENESDKWLAREQNVIRQTSEMSFREFVNDTNAATMQMEQNAPVNGIGHVTGVSTVVTEESKKWLDKQPAWLQREYAPRVTSYFGDKFQRAQQFQVQKEDQFSRTNIEKVTIESANTVDKDPDKADAALAAGQKLIKDSTLDETEKYARQQAMVQTVRGSQLKAEARKNPYLAERGGAEKLAAYESTKNPQVINPWGFAGSYQFGAPLLKDIGVYQPASGENVSPEYWNNAKGKQEKWTGTFNIPDFPEVKNVQDFLNNKAAQDKVYELHTARMDKVIDQKFAGVIGTTVRGVPITREGLRYGMHYSGEGGVQEFLSGGTDRTDANRKRRVSDYIALGRYGEGTIADDPKYNVLPPEQKEGLVRDGEREFRQQEVAAAQASKVEFSQRLDNLDKTLMEGQAGQDEINTAKQTWLTDPQDIARMEARLAQTQKTVVDLGAAQAKYGDRSQMWTGTESDNKMQNLLYASAGGNAAVGRMDQAWMEQTVFGANGFVRHTGFVPPDLVKGLETMARQPDTKRRTWAYQQLSRIQAEIPGALPEGLKKDTLVYEQRAKFLDTDQMQQAYIDDQDPDKLAGRKRRIDDAFNGTTSQMSKVVDTDVIAEITGAGWIASGAGTDPVRSVPQGTLDQFGGELESGIRSFMEANLDFDSALEATKKKMASEWGISPVGRNGLMKYPPSQTGYVRVNGGYEYMDYQAREKIAAHGASKNLVNETEFTFFKPNFDLSLGVPVERPYVLRGDSTTQSQIDAGSKQPSYEVLYLTDQKTWATAGRITFDPARYAAEARSDPVLGARQDAFAKRSKRAYDPLATGDVR